MKAPRRIPRHVPRTTRMYPISWAQDRYYSKATNPCETLPNAVRKTKGGRRRSTENAGSRSHRTILFQLLATNADRFSEEKRRYEQILHRLQASKLNHQVRYRTDGKQEDIMTTLCDDRYFTKIDLAKGYWQIPVKEESKPMTSFSTHNGSYQFRMMPFSLVNSGATFNKMMRKLLKGCEHVDNYVDDILGHTVSWDSHLQMLRNLFIRIRQAGLTVRPTKCYIGYKTIDFTGHLVGEGEVRMEDKKINKIKNAEEPTTKKQVRSFLKPSELLPQVHSELCNHRSAANRPYQEGDAQQGRVGTSSGASI